MSAATAEAAPTLGALLTAIGQALCEVGERLDAPPVVTPEPRPPRLLRKSGRITHPWRMRMQERVLGELERRGGTMSRNAFAEYAKTQAGYGKGYAQFYAGSDDSKRLCSLSADRKTVTITSRGKVRLAYAREFLGDVEVLEN